MQKPARIMCRSIHHAIQLGCAAIGMVISGCCGTSPAAHPRTNDHASTWIQLCDGQTLNGWRGWTGDPWLQGPTDDRHPLMEQSIADQRMREHWHIHDGTLHFDGKGNSLCTAQSFSDFELTLDWKILPGGDSGLYLRGCPQVQIWDNSIGSGGLYNNQRNSSNPLVKADRPPGEWNTFRIRMVGNRVTVHLNDVLVVDNVELENMWDRSSPVPAAGSIELQAHGSPLWFRNIWIRRLK